MIIVDLNQIMISNFMKAIGNHTNIKIQEDLLRHMILNSIRAINMKWKATYGELVIACDDGQYWRKDLFPYYKANRKKDREESEIDWSAVFLVLNKVRAELKEYFPYRVIQVAKAEADDVIATLCHKFGNTSEKIMIISGDKDFRQLQTYMNVCQYDPVRKKELVEKNPDQYLRSHILRGDKSDGIPNFLSQDDSFVMNVRQKPLREKKIAEWIVMDKPEDFCDETMLRNWYRNEPLVDLWKIPTYIQDNVMEQFEAESGKGRSKLFNYFIEMKLKHLLTDISDF